MKKSKLSSFVVCVLCAVVAVACVEEDNAGEMYTPDELIIDGPGEVNPTETATYLANPFPEATYSWTVPNGATITEGDGTSSVTVTFPAGSSGDISVSARGVSGTKTVTVTSPAPMVSVAIDSGTVLSEGQTANVTVNFDRDINTAPDITFVPTEGSTSSIGSVERVDGSTFQFSYSAGVGDITDQITVSNAVASEEFGGAAMDTVIAFDLYEVDNTPATGELFASQTPVKDSMIVTISAVFSEPLSTADSVQISIESADDGLTGITYANGATMTTEDGMTWTYEFQPTEGRDDIVVVSVSNVPDDRAGNTTDINLIEPIFIQIRGEE